VPAAIAVKDGTCETLRPLDKMTIMTLETLRISAAGEDVERYRALVCGFC
jgi:hypothetical protein